MITIKIAGVEREWDSLRAVEESWVNQHLHRHRPGQPPCIVVRINSDPVYVTLATPGCGAAGGGGRLPNEVERQVFDLWSEWGLHGTGGGNLIAFLRRLGRLL